MKNTGPQLFLVTAFAVMIAAINAILWFTPLKRLLGNNVVVVSVLISGALLFFMILIKRQLARITEIDRFNGSAHILSRKRWIVINLVVLPIVIVLTLFMFPKDFSLLGFIITMILFLVMQFFFFH